MRKASTAIGELKRLNMLTSHGTESVFPIWIIVSSGTTPLHVVTTAVRCAVGVVASIILEGKLAQSTIWISSTSRHKLWKAKKGTIRQTKREILIHYINLHPSENILYVGFDQGLAPLPRRPCSVAMLVKTNINWVVCWFKSMYSRYIKKEALRCTYGSFGYRMSTSRCYHSQM